jgi:hypothetical protein
MEALYNTTCQYQRDGQDNVNSFKCFDDVVVQSWNLLFNEFDIIKVPPHSKDIRISKASTPSSNTLQVLFTSSCSDHTYTECAIIPTA